MYYIYKMCHTPTGRIYIGQRKLRKGKKNPETDGYYGSGTVWKGIYKAHPDECVKVILEVVESKREVDELEKKYIAHYRSVYGELCVNIADGGDGFCGKHSEETRRKMSDSRKGKPTWNKGKKCPQLSESHRGEKHPNFGKHHSEETRKKISEAKTGKHLSEEHRKKLSESHKGKKLSEKTRRKMSLSRMGEKNHNFGKHLSEETKRKLSEAHKARKRRKDNA